MENENITNTQENENVDYIQAIQELKNNTVSKDQYAKLKEENSKLLKSLINGDPMDADQLPEKPDIDKLRNELFSGEPHMLNLDYVTKALELRDAVIEQGGTDPFLPVGSKITPDNNDIECANRVAEVLKDCVDYAQGDSLVFTNELQRRMIDTAVPNKNKTRR